MKKYIITLISLLAAASYISAQERPEPQTAPDSVARVLPMESRESEDRQDLRRQRDQAWWSTAKYAFGIHTGVDIGAAVPFPPGRMEASNMTAVPKLNPGLGLSFTTYPVDRFTGTVEVTYKQVGIDAKARVRGQQFSLMDDDGNLRTTEFRGTARVKMSFSMLEIPFYVGYSFGDGRNRVFLGGYYSRVLRADFDTTPLKGVVVDPNAPFGEKPLEITPGQPVPDDVMPVFNDYLDKWDAGMLVGYEWQIVPRVNLSARVSMGFKDIFKKGENYLSYKMLHMRGSVAISYSFLRYTK